MAFPGLNTTFDLLHDAASADGAGAPVADYQVVRSGVAASRQPHRPRLHGDERMDWGQTVLGKVNDYFVGELMPELPAGNANGYAVREADGRFARVAYVEEYAATGNVPAYCVVRCEEVDS